MNFENVSTRLPRIQDADLDGKAVLVRFDHNVVKKGLIKDPYRIDRTIGTLYYIVERGGRPILMTHIGRPRDKKAGDISCHPHDSVEPIAEYLEQKLNTVFFVPKLPVTGKKGITDIGDSLAPHIRKLMNREIGGIYLPNTRWFRGEEDEGFFRDNLAVQLSNCADVYINDAFGSWQPHVSTYDITRYIPSYAGFLMQQEISNLNRVIQPERPFLAVIAGSKYDTKIGPLSAIYRIADSIILGGVLYNAYLCAKYGISIKGVDDKDTEKAQELVTIDRKEQKIIEMPCIVESDSLKGKIQGKYRTIYTKDFSKGNAYNYVLDIDYQSFEDMNVSKTIQNANTIFVNAVMGYTPHFTSGSKALDETICRNVTAHKIFGGGDTLQEFKNLCPGLYLSVLDDTQYYFFTGGGTVLTAIERGSPYGLQPVQALMKSKEMMSKK
jgi:phosphoglycerate kinase